MGVLLKKGQVEGAGEIYTSILRVHGLSGSGEASSMVTAE